MSKTIQVNGKTFLKTYKYSEIKSKITDISNQLNKLNLESPVFLLVLKGSFLFGSELVKRYSTDCTVSFLRTSSYQGMDNSGIFNMGILEKAELEGRDIFLIEDIVDTGRTIIEIHKELAKINYKSLRLITLVDKPAARKHKVKIDYSCFTIPNKFIIGFGLDFDQKCRNLKSLYLEE